MNTNHNKACLVPQCLNTTDKNPHKLFITLPQNVYMRKAWLKFARRDPCSVLNSSSVHICEDHFDLPNDMENYLEYLIKGTVSQIQMKPGCIPRYISAQAIGFKKRPNILKKQRPSTIIYLTEDASRDSSQNQFVKSPHIFGSTFEIPQSAGTDEDDPLSMPASSESTYTTSSENPPQTNELTSPYSIPASPSNESYDPHANSDMKSEDQSDLNNTIIEYINEQQVKLNEKTVEESEDHRKMFLLSLLPDIRIMSDAQMRTFKSRVLAVVNDILQETLQDPVQNPIMQECKLEIVQSIDNDSN